MIKYFFICIFILSTICFANDEQKLVDSLAQTFEAFENKGGYQIWPRFQFNTYPTVVHFNNGHAYSFGLEGDPMTWKKNRVHRYPYLCSIVPLSSLPPLHPSFPIGHQRAFVFSFDHVMGGGMFPLLTLIHERFHLHQFRYFQNRPVREPVESDYELCDMFALMELENRIISGYLETDDTERKLEQLKDYVAVSQVRRLRLEPASVSWEDHQQKMEGLADYASIKTFQVFDVIPGFCAETTLLEMRDKKRGGHSVLLQDALKGRHYFIGAALALALDSYGPSDWKRKIEQGYSLQSLLEEALPLMEGEGLRRVEAVKLSMGWKTILRSIGKQIQREQQERAELLDSFDQQQGITVQVGTPPGHYCASGKHDKSCRINKGLNLFINDRSSAVSQDQDWKLAFDAIPVVLEDSSGGRLFKLDPNIILQIDGRSMALNEVLEKYAFEGLSFTSISFRDSWTQLTSTKRGVLTVNDDFISIQFGS